VCCHISPKNLNASYFSPKKIYSIVLPPSPLQNFWFHPYSCMILQNGGYLAEAIFRFAIFVFY